MTSASSRRAFGASAIAAGSLAALALPGHAPGVNVAVVWIATVIAGSLGVHRAVDASDRVFLALGALPPLLAIVRDAPWVLVVELVAAVSTVAVGAARARAWVSIGKAPLRIAPKLPRGLAVVLGSSFEDFAVQPATLRPALRTSMLSAALVLVFGALFVSADPAFAALTQEWLVPDVDVGLLPARVLVFGTVVAFAGSLTLLPPVLQEAHGSPWMMYRERRVPFKFEPAEWKTGLFLLNVLFASFVAVQITVLFGGHSHVLETTGLTYAEYAREGFFQLIAVAALTLGVVAAAVRSNHETDRRWLRILLGALCAMTLVILASALTRMNLYQEAYGFTRLRLLVDLAIYWLSAVFVVVMAAGVVWEGRWLPRAVVLVTVVAAVGFGVSNPDARIAHRNVERFQESGDIDLAYLASLSADAVPALAELDHPEAGCMIEAILKRSQHGQSTWSFNLSRHHARDVVRPPCTP